ncbi:hypothetical protein HYFRA_00004211 [Hymenoscyphus fraxineus]|uniref:Uncharacterized protein n=1 Tax=Hymenoscyphus fraxineus TaxID=746836 RepID=A0A9N9PNN8_9HELO|nr:hypothetical protein HYFRA_00004211 [Hymenoscyphus fraxineus]
MGEPPEQLLSAFKAAALSVTTLYKTAAQNQSKARADGYQDALDELLAFLDKEDIGLSDGEGWRIRRWATERLDGRDSVSHAESEDENPMDKADGTSSPVIQRSQSATRLSPNPKFARAGSPQRVETVLPTANIPPPVSDPTPPPQPVAQPPIMPPQSFFSFRSSHPYPQDTDSPVADLEMTDNTRTSGHDNSVQSTNPGITITRPQRNASRHNTHSARTGTRSSGTIGKGAGQKRKINMHEFFDIGNVTKDNFGGGGKRGRFI